MRYGALQLQLRASDEAMIACSVARATHWPVLMRCTASSLCEDDDGGRSPVGRRSL